MRHRHRGQKWGMGRGRQTRWLIPSILYLIWKEPRHGYSLMNELPQLGFTPGEVDPGAVYRTLNMLEENGWVVSEWDTSGSGPARRRYAITPLGVEHVVEWSEFMRERRDALDRFIKHIESLHAQYRPDSDPNS